MHCHFKLLSSTLYWYSWIFVQIIILHDSRLVPGSRTGIAAAAVGGGEGSSGRSLVWSIKICISVCSWTARWLKYWEWSDVNATTAENEEKPCTGQVFSHQVKLLDQEAMFYSFHIGKPNSYINSKTNLLTCVKRPSFQLNLARGCLWSSGCLCCWMSWSLLHYLQMQTASACWPNLS